jgi:hypothetical protein
MSKNLEKTGKKKLVRKVFFALFLLIAVYGLVGAEPTKPAPPNPAAVELQQFLYEWHGKFTIKEVISVGAKTPEMKVDFPQYRNYEVPLAYLMNQPPYWAAPGIYNGTDDMVVIKPNTPTHVLLFASNYLATKLQPEVATDRLLRGKVATIETKQTDQGTEIASLDNRTVWMGIIGIILGCVFVAAIIYESRQTKEDVLDEVDNKLKERDSEQTKAQNHATPETTAKKEKEPVVAPKNNATAATMNGGSNGGTSTKKQPEPKPASATVEIYHPSDARVDQILEHRPAALTALPGPGDEPKNGGDTVKTTEGEKKTTSKN